MTDLHQTGLLIIELCLSTAMCLRYTQVYTLAAVLYMVIPGKDVLHVFNYSPFWDKTSYMLHITVLFLAI